MNDLVLGGEREAVANLPEHVIAAFDFAIGLWPHSMAPGSTAVRIAWAPALMRYSYPELCNALDRLALSGDFPTKHALVGLLRELFPRDAVPRVTRGAPGTMREGVRMWRDSELAELADRAARGTDDAAAAAEREDFLARARNLFPEHRDLFLSAPAPTEADAAAVAFVDALERGEDPDKSALSPEAVEAARQEWTRRHPRAQAS